VCHSYKRLVENYWAPVSVSWGIDSRHSAVRVIAPPSTSAGATRMEMASIVPVWECLF
jgi:glutamine synthetase